MKLHRIAPAMTLALAASLTLAACGGDPDVSTGNGTTPATTDDNGADNGDDNEDSTDGDNGAGAGGDDGGGGDLAGQLPAAGASAQNSAMTAWISEYAGIQPGVEVTYDSVGSGAGVTAMAQGAAVFAGSDSYLNDERRDSLADTCGDESAINLPVYISPIAVAYNLPGVEGLRMSPEVIAQVFNQEISTWNDPAIADLNPDLDLPDQRITVVNRSDESGTTDNFTKYLAAAAGDAWPHEPSNIWPVSGGEAGAQTAGVISILSSTEGTIGYSDASAVGGLSTVHVGVGDDFVEFSPEAAALVVEASPRAETGVEGDLAVDLDYATTEAGAYPIVLISYHIVCKNYGDANTADLVKDFISFVISEEGQSVSAEAAGSAPISDGLRSDAQASVDAITGG